MTGTTSQIKRVAHDMEKMSALVEAWVERRDEVCKTGKDLGERVQLVIEAVCSFSEATRTVQLSSPLTDGRRAQLRVAGEGDLLLEYYYQGEQPHTLYNLSRIVHENAPWEPLPL